MVQWLRLGAFTALAQVQFQVGELRSYKVVWFGHSGKKKKKSELFFLAAALGKWDLSSVTRDQTHTPCLGSEES